MNDYNFTIIIESFPKLRARQGTNKRTGKRYFYTPKKTATFEQSLSFLVRSKFKQLPLLDSVGIDIVCFITRPKSVKRKFPCVKPDNDNYLKSICDSLNGILFADDGQIIDSRIRKFYADDCLPCIKISVWKID
jgi:Holliday junction resolvase RusA-like endonuclease